MTSVGYEREIKETLTAVGAPHVTVSFFVFFGVAHAGCTTGTEEETLLQQRGGRYAHTHTHTDTHNRFSMASRYVEAIDRW